MTSLSKWEYERNTAMKVFSQLYVGLRASKDGMPLGFATPYEENAAGRKRQETVDRWAAGYGTWVDGKHVPGKADTKVVANEPRAGWRVTDDIKRVYWGGGNVVWRVEDPHGYELEIQSRNLMALIQVSGIEAGGLIPGKCLVGRSGGDNILLHEASQEFKDAVMAAEKLKAPKQVGKAARRVGAVYRLADGTSAVYVGKVHVSTIRYPDHDSEDVFQRTVKFEPANGVSGLKRDAIMNCYWYRLEPSEPFEAVVLVEPDEHDQPRLSTNMRLYKKAPLVDELLTPSDELTPRSLDDYRWSFASSSIQYKRIGSVTYTPILNPVLKFKSWDERKYEQRREVLQHRMHVYGQTLSRPTLYGILDDGDVALVNGKPCGTLGMAGNWDSHKRDGKAVQFFGVPLTIKEKSFIEVTNTDALGHVFSDYRGHFGRGVPPDLEFTKLELIPYMGSPEAVLAYYDKLWNDRALFTTVIRDDGP